jgi:hypothetical protein
MRLIEPLCVRKIVTPEKLEETLRSFKYRIPFQPFIVTLADGRTFVVDDADAVGFSEGAVGFLSPQYDFLMVQYEDVGAIRPAATEMAP